MNKFTITIFAFILTISMCAQDASVEKSVFGVQTGLVGLWVHNEVKLSNSIALRSELGVELGYYDNNITNTSGILIAPSIAIEPRWYYNLNKRQNKSKRIDGNSGNFIALKTTYHPDLLLYSSNDNVTLASDLSIVPTWGIRRNIGNHFNYEAAFGVGYLHIFKEQNVYIVNESDVAVNLHIRIGYRF